MEDQNTEKTFRPDVETIKRVITLEAMLTVSLNLQSDLLAKATGRIESEVRDETWTRVDSARRQIVEDFESQL